jgi:DNA mismatch repair ATPase MutS
MLEEGWVAGGRNNWIVAVATGAGPSVGLAAIDLTTGEFLLESTSADGLAEALGRLSPAELVLPIGATLPAEPEVMRSVREAWEFDPALAREEIARRFKIASLDGLGLGDDDAGAVGAAGALLRYLADLKPGGLPHLARPSIRRSDGLLWVDEMTRRNLELVEPLRAGAKGVTLLEVVDRTVTPMGARLLRRWILSPLSNPVEITRRLEAVDAAVSDPSRRAEVREALDGIRDLERLAGRAAAGRATPRELGALRDSFLRLPDVLQGLRGLAGRTDAADEHHLPSPTQPSSLCLLLKDLDLLRIWPRALPRASPSGPRRCWERAASSRRVTTPRWMKAGRFAMAASNTSRPFSSGNGSGPVFLRSRSGTTRCSGITSRSPTPMRPRSPPITSAARPSRRRNAT